MILADTSIVVAVWRKPSRRLLDLVIVHDAAVCGITTAELYAGARIPRQVARCAAVLSAFGQIALPDSVWQRVGHNLA